MTTEKVFKDLTLYEKLSLDLSTEEKKSETGRKLLDSIYFHDKSLDLYCPYCKKESVFNRGRIQTGSGSSPFAQGYKPMDPGIEFIISITGQPKIIKLFCSRDGSHQITYVFVIRESFFTKIGQYPSVADLSFIKAPTKEYLNRVSKVEEFKKAISLHSHGIGIGAFVYLRRIFEHIISINLNNKIEKGELSKEVCNEKIEEKILLLKDVLPSFMVEKRKIYSVLSKGIHELEEEECLRYFEILRHGIEIICEEMLLEEKRRQEKTKFEKEFNNIIKGLKNP